MDATCDFQEEKKKGREKPQVMHIRLRIYHIFLSWSVSKLVYNLASVCVFERERERERERESTYTFIHVELCRQAFSELDMTCVSKAVLTFVALLCGVALCCVSQCVSTVTWPPIAHTYHFSIEHGHRGKRSVRRRFQLLHITQITLWIFIWHCLTVLV